MINENEQNYLKIQFYLAEITKKLMDIFKTKWLKVNKYDWGNEKRKKLLIKELYINLVKNQKKSIESKDIQEWDISLYYTIFNYSNMLYQKELSNGIYQIKKVRNDFAHNLISN